MKAAALLPWIPVFPLIGFLINGFLYLISHSKMGDKNAPLGAHGDGLAARETLGEQRGRGSAVLTIERKREGRL